MTFPIPNHDAVITGTPVECAIIEHQLDRTDFDLRGLFRNAGLEVDDLSVDWCADKVNADVSLIIKTGENKNDPKLSISLADWNCTHGAAEGVRDLAGRLATLSEGLFRSLEGK